jgi:hypothetical protein
VVHVVPAASPDPRQVYHTWSMCCNSPLTAVRDDQKWHTEAHRHRDGHDKLNWVAQSD